MVDMRRLYLKVYIPEPDIPKVKLGDSADITVDAFPGRTFPARITKIYDQAEFTPKNVETKEERVKLVFGVELNFVQARSGTEAGHAGGLRHPSGDEMNEAAVSVIEAVDLWKSTVPGASGLKQCAVFLFAPDEERSWV